MDQIALCDWLPERVRWSYLARSGLPVMSREKKFPESQIINLLLTRMVGYWPRSFLASLWTSTPSRSKNTHKKRTWPISSYLDRTLGQ